MKTFMNTFGGILVVLGLMAVAGSGGDCDGKCGPGNDIGTMLLIVAGGITAMGLGGFMMYLVNDDA